MADVTIEGSGGVEVAAFGGREGLGIPICAGYPALYCTRPASQSATFAQRVSFVSPHDPVAARGVEWLVVDLTLG